MKKRSLIPAVLGLSLLLLSGCDKLSPSLETLGESGESATAESSAPAETTTEAPTVAPTTETTPETTPAPSQITIDITTEAETTAPSNGRMEANNLTYENNNVVVNYPELVGMSDTEVQDWANQEIEKDVMSLLKYYDVDEETDTLELKYDVSTIYRGEFSLVYEGTLVKGGKKIHIKAAEDLDLSEKKHFRLSDRLSSTKLIKCVLEDEKYDILDTSLNEETLRTYLSNQEEDFYTSLISKADFGGSSDCEGAYSYNHMGNVAIVIPLPNMMGDYAVISIKQQSK